MLYVHVVALTDPVPTFELTVRNALDQLAISIHLSKTKLNIYYYSYSFIIICV